MKFSNAFNSFCSTNGFTSGKSELTSLFLRPVTAVVVVGTKFKPPIPVPKPPKPPKPPPLKRLMKMRKNGIPITPNAATTNSPMIMASMGPPKLLNP